VADKDKIKTSAKINSTIFDVICQHFRTNDSRCQVKNDFSGRIWATGAWS